MFLILMVIGLVGLATMALPALFPNSGAGHGGPSLGRGPAAPHAPIGAHAPHGIAVRSPVKGGADRDLLPAEAGSAKRNWVPSPRGVFTALALFGAFGNAMRLVFPNSTLLAALAALLPTLLVERVLVRPLWNLVFRFQAAPERSLVELTRSEALAVVPFRNGRGIIVANRNGRAVQLSARLCDAEANLPVNVGDKLCIEEVDAERERVIVSLMHGG